MKKFTCKELGGSCDEVFSGATAEEVVKKGGQHIMTSTDEAHKPVRERMANNSEEESSKWRKWFNGEWEKKEEESH